MPMSIKVKSQCQDSSRLKLKYLITCTEFKNEDYSSYDIENIVKGRVRFIQEMYRLQIHVEGNKVEKDSDVIVRVACKKPKYSMEKICQNNLKWSYMIGYIEWSSRTYDCSSIIFEFSINISAYIMKNVVQEKLYNDCEFTDFCLTTAEGTGSVPVHKAHLAAHSDVFREMLSREWKETNEGRISMQGITLQTLQQLKDFIYLGTLPEDLLPLWSIASCYFIEDLKAKCLLKLPDIIKPQNFYSMLEYSIENNMPELTFAIIKATPKKMVWDAEKMGEKKSNDVL